MLLFYFSELSQLFGTNSLHWDIFGWKWQKSSLNWPKQTNKQERNLLACVVEKLQGFGPSHGWDPGDQMTGRNSFLLSCFGLHF